MLSLEIENRLPEIQAEIKKFSAELVDISFRKTGDRSILTVLADKPGGINLDDCANINRGITGLTGGVYDVEVSSPGLDRPLKTCEDFSRVIGQRVRVISRTAEGKTDIRTGEVLSVRREGVELKLVAAQPSIFLPMGSIVRGVREI